MTMTTPSVTIRITSNLQPDVISQAGDFSLIFQAVPVLLVTAPTHSHLSGGSPADEMD